MKEPRIVDVGTAAALADRCVDHLRVEELFRARAIAVFDAVQQALSGGRWGALAELGPLQAQLAEESDQLRQARQRLCIDAGKTLAVPAEGLSLEQIARCLPQPHAERLLKQRAEMRGRILETQRLAQACGVIARYHLDFIQRFFADLTGTADSACYGPEGTLRPSACRSLLQARG